VVVARELTKRFETFLAGSPTELARRLEADDQQRLGEFVLLVAGAPVAHGVDRVEQERVLRILSDSGLSLAQAVVAAARLTGVKKNLLYRLALDLRLGDPAAPAD
jgi:16S rRNA (cytidine1402-2'-O)-methyltransferase